MQALPSVWRKSAPRAKRLNIGVTFAVLLVNRIGSTTLQIADFIGRAVGLAGSHYFHGRASVPIIFAGLMLMTSLGSNALISWPAGSFR